MSLILLNLIHITLYLFIIRACFILELINYKEIVLTREEKFNEIVGENSVTSD